MDNTNVLIKKKREKKKTKTRYAMAFICFFVVCAGLFFYKKQAEDKAQENPYDRSKVILTESQQWLELEIKEIIGNEIIADGSLYQIPVGTDVVTKLGNVTTFSRLSAGDRIVCLTEQQGDTLVMLKIWIEE